MPYITIRGQSYQDLKTQECGMRWDVVIKRWAKETRLKDATLELRTVKIVKE